MVEHPSPPPSRLDPAGPNGEPLDYPCGRVTLHGTLFRPRGGLERAPGVLVGHTALGIGEHVRARAQALAARGHLALAWDLYGVEGFPAGEAMALHRAIADVPGLMHARAAAALEALAQTPGVDPDRIAAIGFCQGGIAAMELARARAPIRAAIGIHPGLERPAGSADGPIAARVLMVIGDEDAITPPPLCRAFAEEMTAKRAPWEMVLLGGITHSFSEPDVDRHGDPGFRYDARADRRSWQLALDLLDEVFA